MDSLGAAQAMPLVDLSLPEAEAAQMVRRACIGPGFFYSESHMEVHANNVPPMCHHAMIIMGLYLLATGNWIVPLSSVQSATMVYQSN